MTVHKRKHSDEDIIKLLGGVENRALPVANTLKQIELGGRSSLPYPQAKN